MPTDPDITSIPEPVRAAVDTLLAELITQTRRANEAEVLAGELGALLSEMAMAVKKDTRLAGIYPGLLTVARAAIAKAGSRHE